PTVNLLATSSIVPNLYYGPFLCDWWHVKFIKENEVTKQTFYLFQFFEANGIPGDLSNKPTQVMHFDQKNFSELISNIPFQPLNISINKLIIIIHSIGISLNKDWNYTDEEYSIS
ncbi:2578_t:CDS:2, partial [Gigaspora margarita]